MSNRTDALESVAVCARAWVACSHEQMRQEVGKGHCPHTILNGGDQNESCFKRTLDALIALDSSHPDES